MFTFSFFKYEHIYNYRRKEFQNILERKLCNCLGLLLLVYYKYVEHGIEDDNDNAYRVYIHQAFLNFTADLINSLQLKQMMNLTVCQVFNKVFLYLFMEKKNSYLALVAPEYWEALSEVLAIEIDQLQRMVSVIVTRNTKPFL